MMPLYDMMKTAQNGDAVRAMAEQFALDENQVEQAMAALLPAFSTGLKRNASNPADMSDFLSALASGNHAQYFDNMQNAFTPQGMDDGNGILGHLFGSKDVSRAIAKQAEAATGIGQDIFKQLLPVIASTMMGGLFKQSTGQMQAGSSRGSNPVGDLISQMMRQGLGGSKAQRTPQAAPMDYPLGQILQGMFGGGQQHVAETSDRQSDGNPSGGNPLGQIFEDMLGNAMGVSPSRQAPESAPSSQQGNPYGELFGKMFESGRDVQQGYQANVESIFDQYLQGMNRR